MKRKATQGNSNTPSVHARQHGSARYKKGFDGRKQRIRGLAAVGTVPPQRKDLRSRWREGTNGAVAMEFAISQRETTRLDA